MRPIGEPMRPCKPHTLKLVDRSDEVKVVLHYSHVEIQVCDPMGTCARYNALHPDHRQHFLDEVDRLTPTRKRRYAVAVAQLREENPILTKQ